MIITRLITLLRESIKAQTQEKPVIEEKPQSQTPQPTEKKLSLKRRDIPEGAYTGLVIDVRGKKLIGVYLLRYMIR